MRIRPQFPVQLLAFVALTACGSERITLTVAQVERVRAGVSVAEPAHPQEAVDAVVRLVPGSVVGTDDTGRALVVLDHGERVLLDRGTRIRVTSAGGFDLDVGRVWVTAAATVDPLAGDAAQLKAGSATLHLRGVRASVARQGDGATLDVLGGEVAWSSGSRQGAVHAGERATLRGAEASVTARTLFDDWTGGLADDLPAGVTVGGAVGLGSVAARRPDEQGAPRWPLVVQRLDARVAVVGDLAITELEQTFFNPASDTVEGLYTLAIPRGAVLQRFAVDRRGELVDGFVRERNVAARDYQAQVYQGSTHDPALLEWDAPGRYHARLYPITPGMTRRVLVTYTQWLTPRPDGGRTYRLPLASLGVRVGELRADVDISRARAAEVRATDGTRRDDTHVTYLRSDVVPTSDFVLDLRGAPPTDVSAVRVAGRSSGSTGEDRYGFFRVAVQAPEPEARSARDRGVDLVVIVDHSAATDPTAQQLGNAFADALARSLHEGDRLLVLAGDVSARPMGGAGARLEPVTAAKRQELLEALARDRRGGATDLGAMIEAAHGALDPQRNGAVVYIGDGQATVGEGDVASLRARVARMNPRPRLYAVAVGEAPRLDLLAGITEPSGFAARVERRADVARTAIELLTHATRPLVRGFRVDLGPGVERVYPSEPVDVPAGEPLVVVGRYTRDPPARVRVRAMWNGRETARDLAFTSTVLADHGDLRYRWATARLDHLLAAGESRAVVVELGTRFGLITPFTSLYVPSEDEPVPPRNDWRTSDARDELSVFDLLPLVGCSRSRDEAPMASPASTPTSTAQPAAPSAQTARAADQLEGGSGSRHGGAEGRVSARGGRYATRGGESAREAAEEQATAASETAANRPAQPSTDDPAAAVTPEAPPPPPEATVASTTVAAPAPVMIPMGANNGVFAATGGAPGAGGGDLANQQQAPRARRALGLANERNRDRGEADGTNGDESSARRGALPADIERVTDDLLASGRQTQPHLARQGGRRGGNGDGDDDAARAASRVLSRCSDAAAVTLSERVPLWRERLQSRRGANGALGVWGEAKRACELPGQADRVALLRLLVGAMGGVDGQLALYRGLRSEPGARAWVRDVILRTLARTGELARASALGLARLDGETLTAALARAATPQERLNVLRALVRRYPDDLDLSLLVLDAAAASGDVAEVRRTSARLREDPRADARVRTVVGEALLAVGDEADARRAFSEIVEFAPDDPWARRRLGDIALAHGWALEAYRQFQTLAARLNDAPEILLRLAWAARGQGRLDEALRLAERVTTQTAPGAQGTVSEAAAAWIAAELALAGAAADVPAAQLAGLRARWRRSPAARSAGAVRVVLRWNHPDDEAELWVRGAGEGSRRADLVASLVPLETAVWAEAPESLEVELRRGGGARPRGDAEVVVIWNEGTSRERVAHQRVRFDPEHPRFVFSARDGALTAVAVGGCAVKRSTWAIVACVSVAACDAKVTAGATTCASVEVLHPGVELTGASGAGGVLRAGRVESAGRLRTAPEGRAVVRTDDGLELRVAGSSEVAFADGRARVERGRVFVSSWGDGERSFGVGADTVIRLADASLEVERGVAGAPATRVIAVRGEVSYQQGSRQGQLAQGESLEGDGALTPRPATLWDDWTGGAASPQGIAHRGAVGAASMSAHVTSGEAPSALSTNEHNVTVRILGDMAVTTVLQRFFNGSEQAAPVEYRLRVPDGAVISGFRVEQGGAWVTAAPGSVAATGGGLPGLLGDAEGGAHANLGSLSPGESLRAEVSYVEWLTREGTQRAYVYPMGDPVAPQIVGEFVLDVDLTRARSRTARPPEGARLESDGHVRMRRSDWRPRGDLVVDFTDASAVAAPSARAWRSDSEGPDGYRHLLVDLSLPTETPRGTDLAIVLDDSAATDPSALEVARAAVDAALHQLGPDDRVALFLGDLGARAVEGSAGRMEPVSDARREAILDAIAHARPGGASDLGRMIVDARAALDPARNGSVWYLGDATPTVGSLDPARLVEETARQAPDLRLYALALGASSHPEVLRPLTEDGGLTLRVEDASEAVAAAHRICAHALRPCLRDVRVTLGERVTHALPARVRAWVAGDPLRFIGELTGRRTPDEVVVEAREGTTSRRWTLKLDVRDINDRGDLSRRWASSRIGTLGLTGSGRASIAELGARYGVVTEVSALVVGAVPGAWANGAITVSASPWPVNVPARHLPQLGVSSTLGPRGVQRIGGGREVSVAVDDANGWRPHHLGEAGGSYVGATLSEALGAADAAARACVERKRALRPSLAGTVTVSALVDAEGHVTEALIASSSLGDGETDGCIARAVRGLSLPPPTLLGAAPGRVARSFAFGAVAGSGAAARNCAPTSRLPRSLRRLLWRERLAARGVGWSAALSVWTDAAARCELRWWEDRVALLELLVDELGDPAQVVELRNALTDPGAVDWLDAAIARRFGASWVWRAHQARRVMIDWDALLTRLAAPGITPAQKVTLLRAWLAVAPRDIDLRLRLMAALEEAALPREARSLGDRLRRDPIADARVRGQVAEFLLRVGDRTEALRAFTEIAEFAPYDPYARARLGDLLLTYGWAPEAYHHYQTLTLLQPGDSLALVRVALAALASGREDEGLRLLRRSAEESGGDASGIVARRILDAEVARVAAARPNDPAVRAWLRAATPVGSSRDTELTVRWTHPDVGVEILSRPAAETAFTAVGEAPAAIGLRAWTPAGPLDGTRLVIRAPVGLQGGRVAEARVQLLTPGETGVQLLERVVRFDREHRAFGFVAQGGSLVEEPVAPTEVPARVEALE